MAEQTLAADAALYLADEVAWLELAAELARDGRAAEIDPSSLAEFLSDMSKRERKEVESRLIVLMTHALKWAFQQEKRTRSWQLTIEEQQDEVKDALDSRTLRNHAEEQLAALYPRAVRRAMIETGLEADAFPADCPYTVDALLSMGLTDETL